MIPRLNRCDMPLPLPRRAIRTVFVGAPNLVMILKWNELCRFEKERGQNLTIPVRAKFPDPLQVINAKVTSP